MCGSLRVTQSILGFSTHTGPGLEEKIIYSLCHGLSYALLQGPSALPFPRTFPLITFSPWAEAEKAAISLKALHLGPCGLKMIPLLNSSQIIQFVCAICFLLGSLLIYRERQDLI